MRLDLNCDLGEGESTAKTRTLMRAITSANVACGGHAGNLRSMEFCALLARENRVRLGAHPGLASEFGRGRADISATELELLLAKQISALAAVAGSTRIRLHHVKLHGSLYHAADKDRGLARAYLNTVARLWPRLIVYARCGGLIHKLAKAHGVTVWPEAFIDRAYQNNGSLVSREDPRALITSSAEVAERIQMLATRGELRSITGEVIALDPKTLCVHSDTANATKIAAVARKALGRG